MIKLIVTDMDGTLLLNDAQEVSEEALGYFETLLNMGIVIVSASGRQYANQKRLYKHLSPQIPMICENGSVTVYQSQIWKTKSMDAQSVKMVYEAFLEEEGELLLSGKENCYVFDTNPKFVHFIREVLQNQTKVVHHFEEIDEPIGKISVMSKDAQRLYEKYLPLWQDRLQVAKSHPRWLDINSKEASKGVALKELLDHLGIHPLEVMAFGDNYNDIDMLELVGFPVAMESGIQEVKKRALACTPRVEDSLRILIDRLKK